MPVAAPGSALHPAPPYAPPDDIAVNSDVDQPETETTREISTSLGPAPASTDPDIIAAAARADPAPPFAESFTPYRPPWVPVPGYDEPGLSGLTEDERIGLGLPLTAYPTVSSTKAQQRQGYICHKFKGSVLADSREVVAAMITTGLVTPDVTDVYGETGLGLAARKGNLPMAKLLVSHGAKPDIIFARRKPHPWSDTQTPSRTPLLFAAEAGHLSMVKYLMSLGADDGFLASDGQLALRLAANNGHKEIVEFLPARRGGAMLRWQTHHAETLKVIKPILVTFVRIGKFFAWHLPKYIVYDVPVLLAKKVAKGVSWSYQHRAAFPGWCQRQGHRLGKGLKRLGNEVMKLPGAVKKGVLAAPRVAKQYAAQVWTAVMITFEWMKTTIVKMSSALAHLVSRILSGLHTTLLAIWMYISLLKTVTLADVGAAYMAVFRALGQIPATVWRALKALVWVGWEVSWRIFGTVGAVIYVLGLIASLLVTYIPHLILEIMASLAGSAAKGGHEILVWFNPKW